MVVTRKSDRKYVSVMGLMAFISNIRICKKSSFFFITFTIPKPVRYTNQQ